MHKTIKEIAQIVGGQVIGDDTAEITGVAGIQEARPGDITFLANKKYLPFLAKTQASAVITSEEVEEGPKPFIRTKNPSLAFEKIVSIFHPSKLKHPEGVHPLSVIDKSAVIGKGVAIGAQVVVEAGASVGENCVIYSGSYIGRDARIGSSTVIYPNVTVREEVIVGNNVIIHSGAVIGSDGFGFITLEGRHTKIPQTGIVVIEDDVEVGALVAIDRARFDKTVIGKGTKIDNLVHIAHNVIIGKNCLIIAQVGISGSTTLGDNVILAGQVGVVGHVNIGDNAIVMAQSGVSKSVPEGAMMWGYPAKPAAEAKKVNACVQNLPKLFDTVKELKKKLEEKLKV